ncbi:hypothetical protein JTB14_036675 [Gonioctena quinquepunctata]|nr:hypothetical protein JTB14_036675 [Gonioctena quinquepunctata]
MSVIQVATNYVSDVWSDFQFAQPSVYDAPHGHVKGVLHIDGNHADAKSIIFFTAIVVHFPFLKPYCCCAIAPFSPSSVYSMNPLIREEMRLLRDSVSFCSDKITDFPSDLTTLRERDRCESGSLKSDGGGVLIALKQGFHAAPQVNLQSEAEDLWISLDAKNDTLVGVDSHHPPLYIDFKLMKFKHLRDEAHKQFNFNKANYEIINSELAVINWSDCFAGKNVNEAVEILYEKLTNIITKNVPTFVIKKGYPSYFKPDTIQLLKEKNKVHKNYKVYGGLHLYQLFSQLRKNSKQLIHRDYTNYINNIENEIPTDSRSF